MLCPNLRLQSLGLIASSSDVPLHLCPLSKDFAVLLFTTLSHYESSLSAQSSPWMSISSSFTDSRPVG